MVSIRNPVAHGAAPDGLTIAALGLMDNLGSMITMASGAFIDIGSEEMISTKTMTAAMTSAGAKAAKYKAPHKK